MIIYYYYFNLLFMFGIFMHWRKPGKISCCLRETMRYGYEASRNVTGTIIACDSDPAIFLRNCPTNWSATDYD